MTNGAVKNHHTKIKESPAVSRFCELLPRTGLAFWDLPAPMGCVRPTRTFGGQYRKFVRTPAFRDVIRPQSPRPSFRVVRIRNFRSGKGQMRISFIVVSFLLTTIAASAAPITQSVGTATILGANYNVSVLGDSAGNPLLQSFNDLSPTITFTTQADAIAAGNALLAAFGTDIDWQPFATQATGGRIAFGTDGSTYDYVTVCCSVDTVNGPFNFPLDYANAFTFIQFSPVPEPLSLSVFAVGLIGAFAIRRHGKRS